ncbi:hypothetical protein KBC51_01100, partial [Candidatus Saccharibacteria bacterium]|nr:hypothetical protein [Candidatus Saccharibacteria bacterium]
LMLSLKCAKLPIFSSQSVRASEAGPADLSVLSERQAGLRVLNVKFKMCKATYIFESICPS